MKLWELKPCPGRRFRGFSLLELLLVVAILLVLFTIYWSPGSSSRERALQSACQGNLQKIHIAMSIFAKDHDGTFPNVPGARTSAAALEPLVPRYNSDTTLFICPASKDSAPSSGKPLRDQRISYAYYMGRSMTNGADLLLTDRQVDARPKVPGQQVFSRDGKAPGNNHGKLGGTLLFCDGHAEISGPKAPVPMPLRPGEVLLNPE